MLTFFELTFTNSYFSKNVDLPLHKLFYSLKSYISILFLQILRVLKIDYYPFCTKTTQDFAQFWEMCGNFKTKTKIEYGGILQKRKWSYSRFLFLHILSVA